MIRNLVWSFVRGACLCGSLLIVAWAHFASAADIPVYLFAGQSNAVGFSTDANQLTGVLSAAQTNVLFYGPTESTASKSWGAMIPPNEVSGTRYNRAFGPEISAAYALQLAAGEQIAVVKYARSSTNLASQWSATNPTSNYYAMYSRTEAALQALRAQGHTPYIAGFFWMQGESDAQNATFAPQYQTNLQNLVERLRSDFKSPNLPFVYGQINNNSGAYQDTVRAAQANLPNLVPNVAMRPTDALQRSSVSGDAIHFSTQGTVDMGQVFADAYATLDQALRPRVNLLTNGSFEMDPTAGTYQGMVSGLTGWTLSGQAVQVRGFSNQLAAHGAQWLSLEGLPGASIANRQATITQTIATVPGLGYEFSFDYSVLGSDSVTGPWTLTFDYGTGPQTLSIANAGQLLLGEWQTFNTSFIASGTSTTISFTGQYRTNGFYGPAIDNVELFAIPEPSTLALGFLALLGFAFHGLRRRHQPQT